MEATSTPITVSELTSAIKNQLEGQFLNLIVQGEISNCKLHSSGHLYFDLKDENAKISAVHFRCDIKPLPKEGDQVVIHGSISVYPPHGKYQILVKKLEYKGVGELLLKLEQLKKTLKARGWFESSKKKVLPKFPKKIGVVTSPTGAVIKDIIHVLSRRFSGFQLLLNPVRVQGMGAAEEIAQAIVEFNRYKLVDVLIIARGGGSIEDLWPFNEEVVAKAIFESAIPIVSAVGHETDFTIADFVADIRAPTPSAAAEIVMKEKKSCLELLEKSKKGMISSLFHLLSRYKAHLNGITRHPLLSTSIALLSQPMQRLDDVKKLLDERVKQEILKKRYLLLARKKQASALKPTAQIHHMKQKLEVLVKQANQTERNLISMKRQKLKEIVQQLKALDPKNVLKRGYSILFALNEGSVIVSARELAVGKQLRAQLSDGEAILRVEDG